MKKPIEPPKPIKPQKPTAPNEFVYVHERLNFTNKGVYGSLYSGGEKLSIQDIINQVPSGVKLDDVFVQIEEDPYDGCGSKYCIIYYLKQLKNPGYEDLHSKYEKKLKKYNEKLNEYNAKLDKWKLEYKQYLKDYSEWEKEDIKLKISFLQRKLLNFNNDN